jgi:hypothetical protein
MVGVINSKLFFKNATWDVWSKLVKLLGVAFLSCWGPFENRLKRWSGSLMFAP